MTLSVALPTLPYPQILHCSVPCCTPASFLLKIPCPPLPWNTAHDASVPHVCIAFQCHTRIYMAALVEVRVRRPVDAPLKALASSCRICVSDFLHGNNTRMHTRARTDM